MAMDRDKIKEGWKLVVELEDLEWKIKYCKDPGTMGVYCNLLERLSPAGKEEVFATIMREAEKDRIELAGKIDEL
jgi:hypothetical protein